MAKESKEKLPLDKIEKRINELKKEYENIRNYKYDKNKYEDEFEVLDEKNNIETVFMMLGIKYDRFSR